MRSTCRTRAGHVSLSCPGFWVTCDPSKKTGVFVLQIVWPFAGALAPRETFVACMKRSRSLAGSKCKLSKPSQIAPLEKQRKNTIYKNIKITRRAAAAAPATREEGVTHI